MFAENFSRLVSLFLVGIYIARHLGPQTFGVLTYAVAFVSVFAVISRLGMDIILVRDLSRHKDHFKTYFSTGFLIMLVGAITGLVVANGLIAILEDDFNTRFYVFLISIGLLFQPFLVVDYAFQAKVRAKYSAIAKTVAYVFGAIVKVALVASDAGLVWLIIAYAVDPALIALALYTMHARQGDGRFLSGFDTRFVKPLLRSSWSMTLSAAAIILYMRIDHLMIKHMLGSYELGLYAAATKLYEGWMVIPYVISVSLLPAIVRLRSDSVDSYQRNLTRIIGIMFWSGIVASAVTLLISNKLIEIAFGPSFSQASDVLVIVMLSAAFTAMGSVTARYLAVEGMERKIALRTVVALIVNILLNLVLIPAYGIRGAAIATLFSIVISNYLIDYTDRDLQALVRMKNRAILIWWHKDA